MWSHTLSNYPHTLKCVEKVQYGILLKISIYFLYEDLLSKIFLYGKCIHNLFSIWKLFVVQISIHTNIYYPTNFLVENLLSDKFPTENSKLFSKKKIFCYPKLFLYEKVLSKILFLYENLLFKQFL